jgi:ABC-2 type transport system ATP-binding protein
VVREPLHWPSVIIRCDNLDQAYGARPVLTGVSFQLEAGCAGLLGPNGAGKSTLMKALLGQRPLRPGQLQVCGHDPASAPLEVRQAIGYMPENDVYLPGTTGLEYCTTCGQLSGMRRADAISRAHEVLHFVGLGEVRYREVDGYSTGMRQRVKLAAALVHGPRLLLLDEPTTGLDPAGREEMLALINEVAHRKGMDVLLSSHILRDIEQTCDQLVVLGEGRVAYAGSRERFMQRESKILHVRAKDGKERLAAALRRAGCAVVEGEGVAYLEVELPAALTPEAIWKLAQAEGLQIRYLAPATVSLEDAFVEAVEPPRKEAR